MDYLWNGWSYFDGTFTGREYLADVIRSNLDYYFYFRIIKNNKVMLQCSSTVNNFFLVGIVTAMATAKQEILGSISRSDKQLMGFFPYGIAQ